MPFNDDASASAIADAKDAAVEAGLRYVLDTAPGITRRRSGRNFSYRSPQGEVVRDAVTLARISSLAIPPAWTEVWICRHANGHIQATGRDQKGRKQYRYHTRWREVRDAAKYDRMVEFAHSLPALRTRVKSDMGRPGLPREKVLATVVHLLETTLIRVGNDDYARQNESFGLTTLRNDHVDVEGAKLRFSFKGKSGKTWRLGVTDRRIARIVRQCQDLPGQELFQYQDAEGALRDVSSADVNAYLREACGQDITAKDFRTWAGTMLAAEALRKMGPANSKREAEKNIVAAVDMTAKRLGNTRSVCRKYYIHPALIEAYLEGSVLPPLPERTWSKRKSKGPTLRQHEMDVLEFLKARLKPKTRRSAEVRGPKRVEIVSNAPAEPVEDIAEEPTQSESESTDTTGELKPTGS